MKHLILLLLVLLPTLGLHGQPVEVIPPENKILSTPGGRFVFGQVSKMARDQYMLDTETGRLWQIVEVEEGRIRLKPVPYQQIIGDEAYIPDPMAEVEQIRAYVRQNTLNSMQQSNQSTNPKKE